MKEIMTVAEAAELLSINKKSLYRLMAARRIPFIRKPGVGYRLLHSQLMDWLQEGFEPPTGWENMV
ncbi:MAG: helix-turn-helix domain-containing protein [Candidatus Aminicenantales bacterium]